MLSVLRKKIKKILTSFATAGHDFSTSEFISVDFSKWPISWFFCLQGLLWGETTDKKSKMFISIRLQISLKIRLRSEAKAKIFSRKIAKRSEAKIFFVCAKRSEANNFSKLRKIAKNCEIAKKFLTRKKSFSAFFYFILVNKFFISDVTSQYRFFGQLSWKYRKAKLVFVY